MHFIHKVVLWEFRITTCWNLYGAPLNQQLESSVQLRIRYFFWPGPSPPLSLSAVSRSSRPWSLFDLPLPQQNRVSSFEHLSLPLLPRALGVFPWPPASRVLQICDSSCFELCWIPLPLSFFDMFWKLTALSASSPVSDVTSNFQSLPKFTDF